MRPPSATRTFFLAFSLMLSLVSGQANSAGLPDPSFANLNALLVQDPAAALPEIEAILALPEAAGDPRMIFDLNFLAAQVLISQGKAAEAAELLEQLGGFAQQYRDQLQIDPVPIWRLAVTQFEAAGDLTAAIRVQAGLLQNLRDTGLAGQALQDAFAVMAGLAQRSGNADLALEFNSALTQSTKPPDDKYNATRGDAEGFKRVEVFYATDRARTGDRYPASFYGAARGPLDYGLLEVTIPDSHVPGAIEAPSFWRLEFGVSAAKHITLSHVTPIDKDSFFARMQDRLTAQSRKEAFVFVHGYNVSFDAAAKRAAQLAYDMNYTGVPVLYSWPSGGSTVSYMSDAAVVQLSARRLSGFLDELVARSGAQTINIVAHSMGNRALTEALELMALRNGQKEGMPPVFDQIVFAAPDVDAGLFAEMLPTIRPMARRLTLYASENDWALVTSRKLHGDAPRAGQGGVDTLALPAIDSVDMSELGEDMLAHSYFAGDSSALVDLASLFWQNLSPEKRCGLEQRAGEAGTSVWHYARDTCPDDAMMAVIATLRQRGDTQPSEVPAIVANMITDVVLARRIETFILRMLTP